MYDKSKSTHFLTSSNSNCQIQTDNHFIYSEVNCMDSYKISINIEFKENDDEKEVYNLIDDIKKLIRKKRKNNLYQSVKNIEITRSSSMMIINQWKEGIESGKKEGLTYQIPLNSNEDSHTEPFFVKGVEDTREEEIGTSTWGN